MPDIAPTLEQLLLSDQQAGSVATARWGDVSMDILPSNLNLSRAELALVVEQERERRLRNVLQDARKAYDYILIDCPPNLGLLTINAFYAADSVLIPVQAQDKAYQAIPLVLESVAKVNRYRETPLEVLGLLVTMWEHTSMARDVYQQVHAEYPDHALRTHIPIRTTARYDSRRSAPVAVYDPRNHVAQAYHELTKELMHRAEHPTAAHA
jgi:chromosome partitioning protein